MRIYLDIDGVLHRLPVSHELEYLPAFEQILRSHPDVQVVISSSWRKDFSLEQLRELFSTDVRHQVVDVTPTLSLSKRHKEIRQHLLATSYRGAYVVLDDSSAEFPANWPRLLLCDPERGFDDERQDALLAQLKGRV